MELLSKINGISVKTNFGLFNKRANIDDEYYHLILLCENQIGWQNLIKLITKAYLDGFYYKPRIDISLLEQYSGGLIGLTACLKGEVPYYLQKGMIDKAREKALESLSRSLQLSKFFK